jgi:hypothetical protein
VVLVVMMHVPFGQSRSAAQGNDRAFIGRVSEDLATLESEYPQLAEYSVPKASDVEKLTISYGFHTHRAEHPGGWTAGVPNPDPDGLWFYIDLHDPSSRAQIHTQPGTAPICFGSNRVSFLILEGSRTKPVAQAIWEILQRGGAKACPNRAG